MLEFLTKLFIGSDTRPDVDTRIRRSHDAMKRISDVVGAILRLGALTTLLVYVYSRDLAEIFQAPTFWGTLEWSRLMFAVFIVVLWFVMCVRVYVYLVFVAIASLFGLFSEDFISEMESYRFASTSEAKDPRIEKKDLKVFVAMMILMIGATVAFLGGIVGMVVLVNEIVVFLETVAGR